MSRGSAAFSCGGRWEYFISGNGMRGNPEQKRDTGLYLSVSFEIQDLLLCRNTREPGEFTPEP